MARRAREITPADQIMFLLGRQATLGHSPPSSPRSTITVRRRLSWVHAAHLPAIPLPIIKSSYISKLAILIHLPNPMSRLIGVAESRLVRARRDSCSSRKCSTRRGRPSRRSRRHSNRRRGRERGLRRRVHHAERRCCVRVLGWHRSSRRRRSRVSRRRFHRDSARFCRRRPHAHSSNKRKGWSRRSLARVARVFFRRALRERAPHSHPQDPQAPPAHSQGRKTGSAPARISLVYP